MKSIEFNFPIYRDGQEVRRLLWEKGNTVETVCLLLGKINKQFVRWLRIYLNKRSNDVCDEGSTFLSFIISSSTVDEFFIEMWYNNG